MLYTMASWFFEFFNVYSLLAGVIVLLWYYHQSTYNYWRKLNVRFLKPVPFFGNTAAIALQLTPTHLVFDKFYKSFYDKPYGGFYDMNTPALLIKDPELVSRILVTDFKNFHDRFFYPNLHSTDQKQNPLFSPHIAIAEGERWRILRQKMSSFFAVHRLKHMYELVSHCITIITNHIDTQLDETGSGDIDVKEMASRLTIDVVGNCAFGIECNSVEAKDEFARMCHETMKPNFMSFVRHIASAFGQRFVNLLSIVPNIRKETSEFFLNLTLDGIQYRRENAVERPDILQLLMNLQNVHEDPKLSVGDVTNIPEIEKFDKFDIAAHTYLFFWAGYETTATTLSFCLYELALNKDIQQRLLTEVQLVRKKYDVINHDSLKEMPYMDAIITETLRMYPPSVTLRRKCTEEYVIPESKLRIPVGTNIFFPIWSIHHDQRYYTNPEIFDPNRFMDGHKQTLRRGLYLPFGDGPRYCMGKAFAETEIKAALFQIILKYDLQPCTKTEIPLTFEKGAFILTTKRGIWINLTRRQPV